MATQKQERVKKIIRLLKRYYPEAHCALVHEGPLQLLVATILSAQCTDERVNQVTPVLFKKYPTAKKLAKAQVTDIEAIIRSTGFYKNKAKNIKKCCGDLVEKHNSVVPKSLDELTALAGVGRKTGNVVLGNAYNIPSGVVVDTHVKRLSNRLGLVKSDNPEIIERQLQKIVPKQHWIMWSHWLIFHGRQVCKARKPKCDTCFLDDLCPKRGVSR